MRKNNNIIEINGQRYDATTGAVLSGPPEHKPKAHPKAVDGVNRHAAKPAAPSAAHRAGPGKHHLAPKKPQPSATLMRQAVKKPAASSKHRLKAQGHIDAPAAQPLNGLLAVNPALRLDEKRLKHAAQITKSHLVRHFSPAVITAAVHPSPMKHPQPSPVASPAPAANDNRPALAAVHHASRRPGKRPRTTAELLDRAVEQATSHRDLPKGPARHSRAKRGLGIGATVVLSVALLGVIVSQNLSNVRLQMASAKAGFSASLPGYRPAGYSLGQLQYGNGVVAVQFNSNSDNRRYTLTQKSTTWDSATLRENFVAPADPRYRTIQDAGRTIFLYGGHNATWINGGIWYQVQTNGSLNDSQLIKLAISL